MPSWTILIRHLESTSYWPHPETGEILEALHYVLDITTPEEASAPVRYWYEEGAKTRCAPKETPAA